MAGILMWIKKSIFTVKIPLIAPTLGGRAPPDLYIGGAAPPPPPGSYSYALCGPLWAMVL